MCDAKVVTMMRPFAFANTRSSALPTVFSEGPWPGTSAFVESLTSSVTPCFAVVREAGEVGRLRVDRRVIDLEVAGVDDRAGGRRDREAEGVDDRVRDADGLDAERADLHDVARHDRAQLDVVDAELLELVGDEAEGQRHAVDRQRQRARRGTAPRRCGLRGRA